MYVCDNVFIYMLISLLKDETWRLDYRKHCNIQILEKSVERKTAIGM